MFLSLFVSLLHGVYDAQGYLPAQGMLCIIVAAVTGTFVASVSRFPASSSSNAALVLPECNILNAAVLKCTQMLECRGDTRLLPEFLALGHQSEAN